MRFRVALDRHDHASAHLEDGSSARVPATRWSSTFFSIAIRVANASTWIEWSITSSDGSSGSTFAGSPPSSAIASRIAARSTIAGTPVKSCSRTRDGSKASSPVGSCSGTQRATASTPHALPLRRAFSSRTRSEYGNRSTSAATSSGKISYSVSPTESRRLSLIAPTVALRRWPAPVLTPRLPRTSSTPARGVLRGFPTCGSARGCLWNVGGLQATATGPPGRVGLTVRFLVRREEAMGSDYRPHSLTVREGHEPPLSQVQVTSLAWGAKGKAKVSEWLGGGPPLNMLPASLATHRAARRSPVNDDAVATSNAAVLGPLAPPASREFGVLGLRHQGNKLRIALARLDDRDLIAVDQCSGRSC